MLPKVSVLMYKGVNGVLSQKWNDACPRARKIL